MSLTYIFNPGDGHDAVACANEREGVEAERVALDAGTKWARLYRVAILRHRDGKRVEYWETRYDGNWYESNRDNLPNKLLDLAAKLPVGGTTKRS